MSTRKIDRLSVEFVPVTVLDDETVVTAWGYVLLPAAQRPEDDETFSGVPTEVEGNKGVLVGPGTDHDLDPGRYRIWIKYSDSPESPVMVADGAIDIT